MSTSEQFLNFVNTSETMLASDAIRSTQAFQEFVGQSISLITKSVREELPRILSDLRVLEGWLLPPEYDLFRVTGISGSEDPYTELLSWALSPEAHPDYALTLQGSWLAKLGIQTGALSIPAKPETQVWTDDGVPDLVLRYDSFAVVVEAKTGTLEHETPSGLPQTIAYPSAIRRYYGLSVDHPVHMVFLTPSRESAANDIAINATYAEFCVAIAKALEQFQCPDAMRFLFSQIVTHLTNYATPRGLNMDKIFGAPRHTRDTDWKDKALLQYLDDLSVLRRVL
jgi:hypothetical protein